MKSYRIAHLWEGSPLLEEEVVDIDLTPQENGTLHCHIRAPFYNDPPPKMPPGSTWELWNYEVVELFFVGDDGHYLEAEFGPHGHYLLLQLDGPRSVIQRELPIAYRATITKDHWSGVVSFPKHLLPQTITHFNLYAIHGSDSERVYQCYHPLPGAKPDFHQPHRFPAYP